MSRNRVIYQSESLYTSKEVNSTATGDHHELIRPLGSTHCHRKDSTATAFPVTTLLGNTTLHEQSNWSKARGAWLAVRRGNWLVGGGGTIDSSTR